MDRGSDYYPTLDVSIDPEKVETEFHQVLNEINPTWSQENVVYERSPLSITRGVLNTMVKCFDRNNPQDAIMIRIYNTQVKQFVDRDVEVKCIKYLHTLDCAPEILAVFKNGFCYRYIHGEILSPKRLTEEPIWKEIAKTLAKFHASKVPDVEVPENADKIIEKFGIFWSQYPKEIADPVQNEKFQREMPPVEHLKEEYDFVIDHCRQTNSPIVLTHNDNRPENIIWNKETGKVHFVDFEAMNYNFQANEIATHMTRYCGLNPPDFSLLPTEEFQKKWLKVYLEEFFAFKGLEDKQVTDRDVEILYVQVTKFYLLMLLLSGAFCPVFMNMIDLQDKLDFLEFGLVSLREYYKQKDHILEMKMPS